jgi:hypothetical protein
MVATPVAIGAIGCPIYVNARAVGEGLDRTPLLVKMSRKGVR